MTTGGCPVVGTEDVVQGYLAHQMFQLHQLELEDQARQQGLVQAAVRARSQNRKAAREARRLRLASDAVGELGGLSHESRTAVRTGR